MKIVHRATSWTTDVAKDTTKLSANLKEMLRGYGGTRGIEIQVQGHESGLNDLVVVAKTRAAAENFEFAEKWAEVKL